MRLPTLSILPTLQEWLFSGKSLLAALLALYLALRLGLPRPFWSMLTAYVVANPFSGAVRSKAAYRVGGTLLGATATTLMVPRLSNAPELLSLALALWVAACLYVSLLDRTPRSYVFMLAGYTAALIGFPTVTHPGAIFDVALARVEEITLGILCASAVHSLIFPRSLAPALLARLDHALTDARHWIGDALHGGAGQGARDRRQLAADITELRLMATHLPFDTSHLRWTAQAIHALQDRLSAVVPLLSAIEDRLQALRQPEGGGLGPEWQRLLDDIARWSGETGESEQAPRLRREIDALTPAIGAGTGWNDALKINLAARLHALLDGWEECRALRARIDAVFHGALPPAAVTEVAQSPRVLHRDRGLALLSAFAAMIAIVGCCAFWIIAAWPAGAAAAMMAAVFCCFFASQDDPVPGIMRFLTYTVLSIPVSALYLLVLLPAVHSFAMLALIVAPTFLLLGVLVARPASAPSAMAFLFGVAGALSMQDTGTADLVSFINSILAQLAGIAAAAMFTRLLRTVSADWTAQRLLRAGWEEMAALGSTSRAPSIAAAAGRMVDRVGLLTARLARTGPQHELNAVDMLGDLRIGLNMTQLAAIRWDARTRSPSPGLDRVMRSLSAHFRERAAQRRPSSPPAEVLADVDRSLRDACARGERVAVGALVGIRRNLFPQAAPYDAHGHPGLNTEAAR